MREQFRARGSFTRIGSIAAAAARKAWDRRARGGYAIVGVSCPRCWLPIQAPECSFPNLCQCGEAWDILEDTLAAHGLLGTSIQFFSSPNVACG